MSSHQLKQLVMNRKKQEGGAEVSADTTQTITQLQLKMKLNLLDFWTKLNPFWE